MALTLRWAPPRSAEPRQADKCRGKPHVMGFHTVRNTFDGSARANPFNGLGVAKLMSKKN